MQKDRRDIESMAFDKLWQDVRYGLRSLIKNPLLVLVAVLSLGFGIGANATVFSVLRSMLTTSITAERPEQLVQMKFNNSTTVSYPNYHDLRDNKIFAGSIAYSTGYSSSINWKSGDDVKSLYCMIVSSNFFDVLGVRAAMGRTFTSKEAEPEANPFYAVVSHAFWVEALGSDSLIVGKVLVLSGQPFTVLGVLPERYHSIAGAGLNPDLYVPLSEHVMAGMSDRSVPLVEMVGRLPESKSSAQAKSELQVAAKDLGNRYPTINKDFAKSVDLRSMSGLDWLKRTDEELIGLPILEMSSVLLIVVALVLLVACANVGNLLLARGVYRQREIAVRIALGATRGQLIRQLLVETFLLSIIAAGLGLLLNFLLTRLISQMKFPLPLPFQLDLAMDWRLVYYSLLLIVMTTILCGLVPALQGTKVALVPALKNEQSSLIRGHFKVRNVFVIIQVSVSLVLMVTAMLFIRNLKQISSTDPGFDVEHTIAADVVLVSGRYTEQQRIVFIDNVLDRLNNIPGVDATSVASFPPVSLNDWGTKIRLENASDAESFRVNIQLIGSKYFQAIGVPFISGHDFERAYAKNSIPAVIVNETLMRRYFGGHSPVGKRLISGKSAFEIIGLIRDSKYRTLGEPPTPVMYESYQQTGGSLGGDYFSLLVRTTGPAQPMVRVVKNMLGEQDPSASVDASTMSERLKPLIFPSKAGALLLGVLAGVGLTLSLIGFYGVMSFAINQRTFEIAVRIALGATPGRIIRLILRDGFVLVGFGLAVGIVLSLFATTLLRSLLAFGLSTADPISFTMAIIGFIFAGICINLLVTRRAIAVDPIISLRCVR